MLKPEQVPEAVVYEVFRRCEWDTESEAAEAIAAALSAWPGMREIYSVQLNMQPALILPLTEASDE